jgi:hypothetical protein
MWVSQNIYTPERFPIRDALADLGIPAKLNAHSEGKPNSIPR